MEKKKIGLKVADGSFYPILDEDSHGKKKLVLTTVNDNQDSVQIDLYRGTGESLEGATYVGSLMVEDIKPESKGTAEIELVLGVDEEGNLESVATDRASGAKQSLSVGLQDLGEESLYEVPDFSLTEEEEESETEPEGDFTDLSDEDIFGEEFEASEEAPEEESEEAPEEEGEAFLEEPAFEEPVEGIEEAELPDLEAGSTGGAESDFDIDFDSEEEDEFDFSALEEPEEDFAADLETEGEEELEAEPVSAVEDEFDSDFGLDLDDELDEELGEVLEEAEEPSREREWEEEKKPEEEEREPSRARPLLVAVLVILALALIGTLLYLFAFMSGDEEPVPGLEAQQGQEQTLAEGPANESAGESTGVSAGEAEAGGAGPSGESDAAGAEGQAGAPAEEEPAGAGAAAEAGEAERDTDWPSKDNLEYTGGVWYKIRWGDTLWEISSSFYDNPWMYGQIAEENEIHNPDRIFAEESIFIPKK